MALRLSSEHKQSLRHYAAPSRWCRDSAASAAFAASGPQQIRSLMSSSAEMRGCSHSQMRYEAQFVLCSPLVSALDDHFRSTFMTC